MTKIDAPRGPGLAKTRGHRLFVRRAVELWASVPGALAKLVRAADIVSEGETRSEGIGRAYYGTTSLLLQATHEQSGLSTAELSGRLEKDPHFRLLAMRLAVREARARAGAEMGPVTADMAFRPTPRGVVVTIDITAELRNTARTSTG